MDEADAIWNRATTPRELAAPGDRALQSVLVVDGQIKNGGLLSALESREAEEFARAADGLDYLGLSEVAGLLRRAYAAAFSDGPLPADRREIHTTELPDPVHDEVEALDDRYAQLVPDDATLEAAFRRRLAECPDDFAPAQ
jgi:Domain of unknown function (DUF4375)